MDWYKDRGNILVGGIFLGSLALLVIIQLILPEYVTIIGLSLILPGVILYIRKSKAQVIKLIEEGKNEYTQIESLFSIYNSLKLTAPLPPMRNWAGSPDFLNRTILEIFENQPKLIVELGSGVSTSVFGATCSRINAKLISVDHDEKYAKQTRQIIDIHDLNSAVEVICAPFNEYSIDGKVWKWYNIEKLAKIKDNTIDLLIIDGPASEDIMGRYPALPLLYSKLAVNAIIILDDSNRKGEKMIISKWLELYDEIKLSLNYTTEKGTHLLKLEKNKIIGSQ